MYIDVSVVVDGGLDSDHELSSFDELQTFIAEEARKAAEDPALAPVQIYVLFHDHPPLEHDEICFCVEYLQDHRPHCTFNIPCAQCGHIENQEPDSQNP